VDPSLAYASVGTTDAYIFITTPKTALRMPFEVGQYNK